jgi:alpha-1,3-rhamnosyltransferase
MEGITNQFSREMKMNDFTFIVLSYNQELWIKNHLDSIKSIVLRYAKDRRINLIVADDCSKDGTLDACDEWLRDNVNLFYKVKILRRANNLGIVKNLLDAIDNVETDTFKFLAADDTYCLFDIFSIFEKYNDMIYISHVNVIGAEDIKRRKEIDLRFAVLNYMSKKNRVADLIKIDDYIAAPSVFIPGYMLKNKEFYDYMAPFKNIEDYPMWIYLLVKKKYDVVVEDKKVINYRLGSGMSNADNSPTRKLFLQEVDYVYKELGSKSHLGCKYFNVYKYYLKVLRLINYRNIS